MVTTTLCAIILTFAAQSVVCHLIAPSPRGLASTKPILSGTRGLHSKASCRPTVHRHLGSRMTVEERNELDHGLAIAPGQARVGSPRRPPTPPAARTGRSRLEVAPFDPSLPLAEVICWYYSTVRLMQDTEQERPVLLVPHWRCGLVLLSCGAAAVTLTLQVLFTNRPQLGLDAEAVASTLTADPAAQILVLYAGLVCLGLGALVVWTFKSSDGKHGQRRGISYAAESISDETRGTRNPATLRDVSLISSALSDISYGAPGLRNLPSSLPFKRGGAEMLEASERIWNKWHRRMGEPVMDASTEVGPAEGGQGDEYMTRTGLQTSNNGRRNGYCDQGDEECMLVSQIEKELNSDEETLVRGTAVAYASIIITIAFAVFAH